MRVTVESRGFVDLNPCSGTFLVVHWLRLCASDGGGPGSIPGQGTRCHMLQLRILHAATKIEDTGCCSKYPAQPNK